MRPVLPRLVVFALLVSVSTATRALADEAPLPPVAPTQSSDMRPALGSLTKEKVDRYLEGIKVNKALYASERDRLTMPDSGLLQTGAWLVVLGGVASFAGAVVLIESAASPPAKQDTGVGLALLGGGLAGGAAGAPCVAASFAVREVRTAAPAPPQAQAARVGASLVWRF